MYCDSYLTLLDDIAVKHYNIVIDNFTYIFYVHYFKEIIINY